MLEYINRRITLLLLSKREAKSIEKSCVLRQALVMVNSANLDK